MHILPDLSAEVISKESLRPPGSRPKRHLTLPPCLAWLRKCMIYQTYLLRRFRTSIFVLLSKPPSAFWRRREIIKTMRAILLATTLVAPALVLGGCASGNLPGGGLLPSANQAVHVLHISHNSVGGSIPSSVGGSIPSSVGGSIPSSVGGSIPSSVGGSIPSLHRSAPSSVGGSIPSSVGGSIPSSVGGSIPSSVGGSIPSSVGGSIPSSVGGSIPSSIGGSIL
jgi:hypothetical protein